MHPPSPINMGEAWTKSVYEALRSSPQWDSILFLLTFDEHGVRYGQLDVGPETDAPCAFWCRVMLITYRHPSASLRAMI